MKNKKPEFSKIILSAVMTTYFITLFVSIYAVIKILADYPEFAVQALTALFGYVGTPTAVAIGFYAWKAKNENIIKIKNSTEIPDNLIGKDTESF